MAAGKEPNPLRGEGPTPGASLGRKPRCRQAWTLGGAGAHDRAPRPAASWRREMDAPEQAAHIRCEALPRGIIFGHGSVCAREGGPTRAGESMREAMSRPACGSVTGLRGGGRGSTATPLDGGNRCPRPPHPRTPRGGPGRRRREGQSGQAWAWARRGAGRRRAPTARADRGEIEGVRGWASWPREMEGWGASAGADEWEEERGGARSGAGARAMVAGHTRQFAVGHGRGALSGPVIREGARRGRPGGVGQLARPGEYSGRGRDARGSSARAGGRRERGRRLCPRGDRSHLAVHPPLQVHTSTYICRYMYIERERHVHLQHHPLRYWPVGSGPWPHGRWGTPPPYVREQPYRGGKPRHDV